MYVIFVENKCKKHTYTVDLNFIKISSNYLLEKVIRFNLPNNFLVVYIHHLTQLKSQRQIAHNIFSVNFSTLLINFLTRYIGSSFLDCFFKLLFSNYIDYNQNYIGVNGCNCNKQKSQWHMFENASLSQYIITQMQTSL